MVGQRDEEILAREFGADGIAAFEIVKDRRQQQALGQSARDGFVESGGIGGRKTAKAQLVARACTPLFKAGPINLVNDLGL